MLGGAKFLLNTNIILSFRMVFIALTLLAKSPVESKQHKVSLSKGLLYHVHVQ